VGVTRPATQDAPRFPLAALPTPLVPARGLSRVTGSEIWVKRDDLTGFAFAGNKARPIELLIGRALHEGYDEVIAAGGVSSNFCQGLAVACQVVGLRCRLVLYGAEPHAAHLNLAVMRRTGAAVVFTGDRDRAATPRYAAAMAEERRRRGANPLVVARGGATPLGACAYTLAADELAQQLEEIGLRPGRVVVAVGSGATLGGLLAGGLPLTLVGAVVSRPLDETRTNVAALANGAACLLGRRPPTLDRLVLVEAREGGFGVATRATTAAAELALRADGLVVEHTYTARSLDVMLSVVQPGEAPTIWWHTGGTLSAVAEMVGAS
jgi:D-cysteine desulfhydrase